MASVNLTGTLTNPEGEPDEGAIVKFTLLTTTGNTVSSSKSQLEVPQDGLYDIDIVYGNLRVDYINEDGSTRFVAIVTVNGDTVATSLPELLNAAVPPTNAQLLEFQGILADAVTAQVAAEAAETGAVAAEATLLAEKLTTVQLIALSNTFAVGSVIDTLGYTSNGDGGGARWVKTNITGQQVSQSPAQIGGAVLNDGSGDVWAKVFKNSYVGNDSTFSPYYTPTNAGRTEERVFFGSAARDASGTRVQAESSTFIADYDFGSYYLERAAQNLSISKRGGIGTVSGTKNSDRYTSMGYEVWLGLAAVIVGDKVGSGGRLYTATVAGTTGTSPPSHTSGTGVDGTVTWQFDDYTYNVAIGEAACALSVADDGSGTWARYTEIVRIPAGGTSFAHEIVVKNKGADVVNSPYDKYPAKSTIGDMYAGGGDPSQGAPTAPSTCGVLFIKNGHTWNKGIVFDKESLTGADGTTGYGTAIAMAKGHIVSWFTPEGLGGAEITSDVTLNSRRGLLAFGNNNVIYRAGGSTVFEASKLNDSSTGGMRAEAYGGNARLSAQGSATDADLLLDGKGVGKVRFGTHATVAAETITGYIEIKDTAGVLRKLAIIS